jgi:S1-C subfamily serine protease
VPQRLAGNVVANFGTWSVNEADKRRSPTQRRTGFVWDEAGDIVTNNHVVAGTSEVAVRLSSGDVVRADIVGTAPNYDLGVIRLRDLTHLPPPIAVGSEGRPAPLVSAIVTAAAGRRSLCVPPT